MRVVLAIAAAALVLLVTPAIAGLAALAAFWRRRK